MSMPSTTIFPPAGSTRRNKALVRVVFPLPVRPTIPILCPPRNVQLMPRRTNGASGRYLICSNNFSQYTNCCWIKVNVKKNYTCKSQISTLPTAGQLDGGQFSSITSGASLGIYMYWLSLSTEMM